LLRVSMTQRRSRVRCKPREVHTELDRPNRSPRGCFFLPTTREAKGSG
jgi:hypothetical protein